MRGKGEVKNNPHSLTADFRKFVSEINLMLSFDGNGPNDYNNSCVEVCSVIDNSTLLSVAKIRHWIAEKGNFINSLS